MNQKRNTSHYLSALLSIIGTLVLAYAALLFLQYNLPIIKSFSVLAGLLGTTLLVIFGSSLVEFFSKKRFIDSWAYKSSPAGRLFTAIIFLVSITVLVYAFLQSALLDYFQPFSLYDDVIYIALGGFVCLILRFLLNTHMLTKDTLAAGSSILIAAASLGFIGIIFGWNATQSDFEFKNITGAPEHLFVGGEEGYASYRIPALLMIPMGSTLANGDVLEDDLALAFAEARVNGSLDNGDIDLVMKRSLNGGDTWSDMRIIREWEDGIGKIGNPTPVFNGETGMIYLFHIAGIKPYTTWIMTSEDGGASFSDAEELGLGIVGPGHGIQIQNGDFAGRLIIPAHLDGSSLVWYSDDHGAAWLQSSPAGSGNESEVAEFGGSGELVMALRPNHPVSQPHGELHALFSFSSDGGIIWTEPVENTDLRTSICMVSLLSGIDGSLNYAYPDDYYSRAKMTIASSTDGGQTYPNKSLVYAGPAGYSDLGALSDGSLLLLFENGAVEYDQRITLVKVAP